MTRLNAMLGENRTTLDSIIQPTNYDIGHVFGTFGSGGSGLASIGVGGRHFKAQGASTSSNPVGSDWLALVAHEIGHQFDADHTFNFGDSQRARLERLRAGERQHADELCGSVRL